MKTKKLAGAAAVGAVTAVTTLLLGATPALAQDDDSTGDSAFALSASGLLDINPISKVKSADGTLVHDELLSIGDVAGKYEDDFAVGVLTSEAESNRAETVVKEVNLLGILKADVIRTWCDGGEGGLQIVNGSVLGHELPETAVPGKSLDLSPLVKLSLNDQKRNTDGSLSVTGIELTVLPGQEAADPDEPLSESEKASLPVLGKLLGKDLPVNTDTVGGLVGELGALGTGGDLQKVTIGNATCQEGGSVDGDNDSVDGDNDSNGSDDGDNSDGDNNSNDDDGDDSGNGGDSDVKADTAPSPSVVKAALPVTG
ncbi:choice-of-anchor P family protein [Pseudonocardia sp. DLS-67]